MADYWVEYLVDKKVWRMAALSVGKLVAWMVVAKVWPMVDRKVLMLVGWKVVPTAELKVDE